MNTPVAFIIFNRPDVTERVFAEIARARPRQLLIIADGPRPDRPGEAEKCAAARAIAERVNWPCDVLKNYSEVNLGCGRREASGMIWIFEQVEEAIILEDDTLPDPTFFRFCEEMLDKYRDDERVMHISGDNWLFSRKRIPYSYFFSNFCLSWGWAGWRRAFRFYDPEMKLWPQLRNTTLLMDALGDKRAVAHWQNRFDMAHRGIDLVNTWDLQWLFTLWAHSGLSVLPNPNLISNLGLNREDATHTKGGATDPRNKQATGEMIFPLKHPPCVARDEEADRLMLDRTILPFLHQRTSYRTLYGKLRRQCVDTLPTPLRELLASLKSKLFQSKQIDVSRSS
jgi:hypothetical protein